MATREHILGRIRRSLGRDALPAKERSALLRKLKKPSRNTIPKRANRPHEGQVDLFVELSQSLDISVDRVSGLGEVPDAVAEYLARHNLPSRVRRAPDPLLDTVPWDKRPTLEVVSGAADGADLASVTPAFAAIAETGTLVMESSAATPASLNFMPDNHVVVLRAGQVVGSLEDAMALLRAKHGPGALPRTVNLISGPSRTADIALTLVKGAHGPRRLHIVLVEDEPT